MNSASFDKGGIVARLEVLLTGSFYRMNDCM
jgi:hypothetical protein